MFSKNKSTRPGDGSATHDKGEINNPDGTKKADVTDSSNVTEPGERDYKQPSLFKNDGTRPDPESPKRDQRGDNKANTETDATGKTRAQAARSVDPHPEAYAGSDATRLPVLDQNEAVQRGKDRAALERQERTNGTLHAMEHITDKSGAEREGEKPRAQREAEAGKQVTKADPNNYNSVIRRAAELGIHTLEVVIKVPEMVAGSVDMSANGNNVLVRALSDVTKGHGYGSDIESALRKCIDQMGRHPTHEVFDQQRRGGALTENDVMDQDPQKQQERNDKKYESQAKATEGLPPATGKDPSVDPKGDKAFEDRNREEVEKAIRGEGPPDPTLADRTRAGVMPVGK